MKLKHLVLIGFILGSSGASAFECRDTPEGMYVYQDDILTAAQKQLNAEEFSQAIAQPLSCLMQNYKAEVGMTRYVAGSCLRRLLGGPEIKGFHKGKNYEQVLKKLTSQQIHQKDLFKNSQLSLFAMAEWDEYQPFCQGVVAESDCVNLLPNTEQIQRQTELLGASSMLVLRSAYKKFSGASKSRVAATILKLYQETPKKQILKCKVIDEIYQELQQPQINLKLQKS